MGQTQAIAIVFSRPHSELLRGNWKAKCDKRNLLIEVILA